MYSKDEIQKIQETYSLEMEWNQEGLTYVLSSRNFAI